MYLEMNYYKGKNAVITGAASGIGKEFACQLAKMDVNLVISDINMENLEKVKKEIESLDIKVFAMKCDVSNQDDVKQLANESIYFLKDIHFVFSNAGIAMGGPFVNFTNDLWKKIIDVNIWGLINVVSSFIPKMLEQYYGHIIVTSSIAGTLGTGGLNPYNTTKFANAGFCESIYGEYHSKGIEVSIICPFPIKTNLIERAGFSFPSNLLNYYQISCEKLGLTKDMEIYKRGIQEAINKAKEFYWNEFTANKGVLRGFGGGVNIEKAVKVYLKKISKKKLYIFERKYGRLFQSIKGLSNYSYKTILNILGQRHIKLLNDMIKIGMDYIDDYLNKIKNNINYQT